MDRIPLCSHFSYTIEVQASETARYFSKSNLRVASLRFSISRTLTKIQRWILLDNLMTLVRSIDPVSWLQTAYYEDSWLQNGTFIQTIDSFQENEIVLNKEDSNRLEKGIGDWISVTIPGNDSSTESYRIVNILGSTDDFDGFPCFSSFILRDDRIETTDSRTSETKILVKLHGSQIYDNHLQIILDHPDVIRVVQMSSIELPLSAKYWIQSRLFLSQIMVNCFIALDIGTIFIIAFLQSRIQEYEINLLKLKGIRNSYIFRIFSIGVILWNLIIILVGFIVGTIAHVGVIALRNAHYIGSIKERCLFTPDILLIFGIYCIVSISSIVVFHWINIRKSKQGEKNYDKSKKFSESLGIWLNSS